ncbi:tetratricopeptide repeat protein [Pedobacter frigidisoli]|uniref:Tetratricopeptide repeat protein n=1 Tax=Pedobacter frigidisoli TaxID=2530455 RepID=A0A4R0P945_9SPHI|nr:tetratricopeptide repeat protein [Pedobacter frigidisoli]TCD11257.1 tetratricopeptide repeat protein [Pedobacter frigidisoli]
MKTISKLFSLLLILSFQISFAQSAEDKALAKSKSQTAFKLEDEEGKFDEAIKLLEESQKLDPDNIDYPYELAYAYSGKKDHQKAAEILIKLLKHKDVFDQVYQTLGNAYDYLGKPEQAMKTYEAGLKKFPNSGKIYAELGNMKLNSNDYNNAIKYYEKGIEMEPTYAANYYRVSKIFLDSDEKLWGMIYGELFMNLDWASERTREMSKLLFDTYKSQIKINGDSASIAFSKNIAMSADAFKDPKNFKLPFQMMYEANTILAVAGQKEINLKSLNEIRTTFLNTYLKDGGDKKYPNVLFDYQKKLQELDFLEPYNYWILGMNEEIEFNKWQLANSSNWNNFMKWFDQNNLVLDETHKFYRIQYK